MPTKPPVFRQSPYPRSTEVDLGRFVSDSLVYLFNNPYDARENVEYKPARDLFFSCEDFGILDDVRLFFHIIYVKLLLTPARLLPQPAERFVNDELYLAISRLARHTRRRLVYLNVCLDALNNSLNQDANLDADDEGRMLLNLVRSFPPVPRLDAPGGPREMLTHLVRLPIYALIQQQTLRIFVDTLQNEANNPATPFAEEVRAEILAMDLGHDRQMQLFFDQLRVGEIFEQVSVEARQRCLDAFVQAHENVERLPDNVPAHVVDGRQVFQLFGTAQRLPHPGEDNFTAVAASIIDAVPLALPLPPSQDDLRNFARRIIPRFNAWFDVVEKENLAITTRNQQNPLTPLVNRVGELHNEVVDLTNQVAGAETRLTFSIDFANALATFIQIDQVLKNSVAEVLGEATNLPANRLPELMGILGRSNQLAQQSALIILGVRDMVAGAREGSPLLHLGAWVDAETGTVPQVEAANNTLSSALTRLENRILPVGGEPVRQLAETLLTSSSEASIFAGGHYQDTSGFRLLLGLKVTRPFDWAEKPNARVHLAFEKVVASQLPWNGKGFGLNMTTKVNNNSFSFSHQTLKTGDIWDTCDSLSVTGPSKGHIVTAIGIVSCETGAVGFHFSRFLPGSTLFTPPSEAYRFVAPVISVGTDLRVEDRWSFILNAAPPSGVSSLERRASVDTAFVMPQTDLNVDATNTALMLRDAITLIDFTALVRALVNGVLLLVLIRLDSSGRHPAVKCLARVVMMQMAGAYFLVTIFSIAHMGFNKLTSRNLYWKAPPVRYLFSATEELFSGTMTKAPDNGIYKLFNFVSLLFCFQYVRNVVLTLPRSRVAGVILLQVTVGFVLLFVVTPQVRRWIHDDEC